MPRSPPPAATSEWHTPQEDAFQKVKRAAQKALVLRNRGVHDDSELHAEGGDAMGDYESPMQHNRDLGEQAMPTEEDAASNKQPRASVEPALARPSEFDLTCGATARPSTFQGENPMTERDTDRTSV